MNTAPFGTVPALTDAPIRPRVYQAAYTVLLAALIGVLSSTVNFDEPSVYRLPVTAAIVGLILVISGFKLGRISKAGLILLLFWTGYATVCFASAIVNRDSIFGEFWQLVGVPAVIFACIPHYTGRQGVKIVTLAIVLGFAPYVIVSLLLHPLSRDYAGVFGNPNAMGIVLAAWLAGLFILLRGYLAESAGRLRDGVGLGLVVLMILAGAVVLLATSSRTSIGTVGGIFLVFLGTLCLGGSRGKFWLMVGLTAAAVAGVYLLVAGGLIDVRLLSGAVDKFDLNVISGRDEIWRTVIRETAVLGHGNLYFATVVGSTAHNNYVEILGAKGYVALAFRFCFDLAAVIMACRLVITRIKVDGYAAGPLIMIVSYIMAGMAEVVNGTLGHGIHVAYLLMIGMMISADSRG